MVNNKNPLVTQDSLQQKQWVDSLYHKMSLEEKVGQLFMVDVFSNKSKQETNQVKKLIEEHHIGGVIFSKGGPVQQAKLTNEFQSASNYPLLIGQDAEWGLAMRLDSTYAFPWNMTLGAVENKELIRLTGAQIGKHAKRMGVHINFAPDVDVNTNPDNPIIGNRSFGENKKRVTEHALAFINGMEQEGVLASAKHFPGHGDTDVDSHKALPILDHDRKRLDEVELYPYKKIISEGVSSILTGHLQVPALDADENRPASLSKPIIEELLKKEMNYKGLITTDALNMKGVAQADNPGQTELDAFLAGNDLLLIPMNTTAGVEKIRQAYKDHKFSEQRLAHSVKKILMAKYKAGTQHFEPIKTKNLVEDLNSINNDLLYETLMEHAVTVVKNNNGILPIQNLEEKTAYVALGDADGADFYKTLKNYGQVDKVEADNLNVLLERLQNYDRVLVGFHKTNDNPWASHDFSDKDMVWLHEIAKNHPTILNVFAQPYALSALRTTTNLDGIVVGYQNSKIAQQKIAQALFGAFGTKGRLPVSVRKNIPEGTKIHTKSLKRLGYGMPESVGMQSKKLEEIDRLAKKAILEKMTPGMQVLVARRGKVVFQKSYGYHTYDKEKRVNNDDLYDIASMTKILATLPLLMELEERGHIDLDGTLTEIFPLLENSNKSEVTIKEALSHYGQFKAWIPFYRNTLDSKNKPSSKYYRKKPDSIFSVKVADELYMRKDYQDSILHTIADSKLNSKKEYKYSDLSFYLFKNFLEHYYDLNLNSLTQNHFYKPLGANYMGYSPLYKFEKDKIIPSEKDDYWRNQTLHGFVNDQGAAMFGGVGGHAGLFSNANDVAKMMQLFLNKGYYGGEQYFQSSTIDKFNTCYYCSKDVRRGVGFDKPQLKGDGPATKYASKHSFGHSGFTGTITWADPDEDLFYVILSNRTYPDPTNDKFVKESIRTKIQKVIYQSIAKPDK